MAPEVGLAAPTTALHRLHQALDDLLDADLALLGSDEHAQLVTGLVRAESRLHAATLDAVGAFDSADVASTSRHRTTKRWLSSRTRLSDGACTGLVAQARALRDHLPATRDLLASGRITPAHTAVITRVVRTVGAQHAAAAEPILVDLARKADPATVGRATAGILAEVDPHEAQRRLHEAYERRGVRLHVVGEHGYLDGVLDLESTELLQTALMPLMRPAGPHDERPADKRRADALLDLATWHLDHGDAPVQGGHRPHLSVVIDADQLPPTNPPQAPGLGWAGTVSLPWTGRAVAAAVARRWACHASLTPVIARLLRRPRHELPLTADPAWLPLTVGRTQRTATAAQLKALTVRDGGCIHPGCSRTPAYCDAHHVVHWIDGGLTDLGNLVLLCRHHHRTLHAGQWTIHPDPGTPGLFWTRDRYGLHQAQTATDRSPPSPVAAA